MEEFLGMIIPLLFNGSSLGEVLELLSGHAGSSGNDGIQAMMREQYRNLKWDNPMRPDKKTLESAASTFLESMSIVPDSDLGQGISKLIGSMYTFAPDFIGTMIGVPNPETFYQSIVSGASGIGVASGVGPTNIFNPVSMKRSYDDAMGMAQTVFDMATTRSDGRRGFNVDFTHGLGMDELGKVTQRVLSSRIPYLDENGSELDLGDEGDADKFKDGLKKFTSKITEAVSMMNKITGSFDETMRALDSMGGGNFLGSTEKKALEVANRAKEMAANIRITSALAGVDPKEVYATIGDHKSYFYGAMGVSQAAAEASGLSANLSDTAYSSAMAYNVWLSQNPNASPQEKEKARLGVDYRTKAYADSSAARAVGIVAAHRDMFTDEQIAKIEYGLKAGEPNLFLPMIKDVVGQSVYYEGMNNDSLMVAYQANGDKETLTRLNMAGIEGNVQEAESRGSESMVETALSDVERNVNFATGRTGSRYLENKEAGIDELRRLAMEHGLTETLVYGGEINGRKLEKMTEGQLRSWLGERGIDPREVRRAELSGRMRNAMEDIRANTMSPEEYESAERRLKDEIGKFYDGSPLKEEYIRRLEDGADISDIMEEAFGRNVIKSSGDRQKFMLGITGGRLTWKQANRETRRLNKLYEQNRPGYTPEEKYGGESAPGGIIPKPGVVIGENGEEKKTRSDSDRFREFAENAIALQEQGLAVLSPGDQGGSIDNTIKAGMGGMLSDLRKKGGSELENAKFDIVSEKFSKYMAESMANGGEWDESVQKSFAKAAIDMRAWELVDKEKMSISEARSKAASELKEGKIEGAAKEVMKLADAAKSNPDAASMDRVFLDTAGIIKETTIKALGNGDPDNEPLQVDIREGESDQDVIKRFSKAAYSRMDNGLIPVPEGHTSDSLMDAAFGRGAVSGFKTTLRYALDGMSPEKQKKVLDALANDSLSRMSQPGATWKSAREDAMRALADNKDIGLTDDEKKKFVKAIEAESSTGESQDVADLLFHAGESLMYYSRRGTGGVESLYALAYNNRTIDSAEQNRKLVTRLKELRKSGMLNVEGEDENLSVTLGAGARAAIDSALNGVEYKTFGEEWRQEKAAEVEKLIDSGMTVNEATETVLSNAKNDAKVNNEQKTAIDTSLKYINERDLSGAWRIGVFRKAAGDTARGLEKYSERKDGAGKGSPSGNRIATKQGQIAAASVTGTPNDAANAVNAAQVKGVEFADRANNPAYKPPEDAIDAILQADDSTASARQNRWYNLINPGSEGGAGSGEGSKDKWDADDFLDASKKVWEGFTDIFKDLEGSYEPSTQGGVGHADGGAGGGKGAGAPHKNESKGWWDAVKSGFGDFFSGKSLDEVLDERFRRGETGGAGGGDRKEGRDDMKNVQRILEEISKSVDSLGRLYKAPLPVAVESGVR